MSVLHPALDLGRPLQAVREAGAAFIPHALSEPFRQELQREIQDGPFERLPDQILPVGAVAGWWRVRISSGCP